MNNETEQQATQVAEETAGKPEVDLSGVEVVSNGQTVDLTDEDKEKTDGTSQAGPAGDKEQTESDVQKDYKDAQASMESAKETLAAKGVDYKILEEEYNDKGELSEASYKALEDAGYPKEVVDAILAGWQAKADAFYDAVVDAAGGKDEYARMTDFVSKQGGKAVEAFNNIVMSGDFNTIQAYIQGVRAQMATKYGTQNPTLMGRGGDAGSTKGFKNQSEMIKAIRDPRYTRDPQYTKEIEKKIVESSFM